MNITIFNEGRDERNKPEVLTIYPKGIGETLAEIVSEIEEAKIIKMASLYEEECGLTEDILDQTDVLVYWSHGGNRLLPDEVAERVYQAVLKGMGFVVLHSANTAKPFVKLMGTSCTMRYRHDDFERLFVVNPTHPIAKGLPPYFELEKEEAYGEFFDIPKPDDVIFLGWFESGEVCRSGCTWTRGYGKIFYFQPGHETNPTYYNKEVRTVIQNACNWAKPDIKRTGQIKCEEIKKTLEDIRKGDIRKGDIRKTDIQK